jgi:hypothetical protein
LTVSREEDPLEPQSPAEDPCESGLRDSLSALEVEKKTGRRIIGMPRSEHLRTRGARQVYELRGGKSIAEVKRQEARFRKYGLTGEDVAVLLLSQNGACVICHVSFSEVDFVIDHCHDSGKVRGLLCPKCNIVLPYWMTPGLLRKMAAYLEAAA